MTVNQSTGTHAAVATPPAGRISVIVAVCLAALILPLSFSGAAVATPAMGRDLGGSAVALTWITNAFMLTFGGLLMTSGALADQYGRKRVFTIGVGLFVAFSLALSFAPSILIIDLLRAGQGVGAAAALAGGSAAMAQEFEGQARIRAFSMLGTTFGIGLAFGPIVAGFLIENFGWRSVFITSTAIGALALLFGVPRMHESRDPNAMGLDWPGVVTFTATLSLLTFGIIQAPESGWSSPLVIGILAGAVAFLGAFIAIENRVARPMLDLSLFRYPRFVGVQLLPIATCYAYVVLLILLPLRFIGVEEMSEIDAGMLMLALSAPMIVVPSIAATLARWVSAGAISAIGLLIASAGILWLGRLAPDAGAATVAPMLLIGIGAGAPWGLMDGLSVSVVPKERAGMASGIFNTSKVASEGLALAIVSTILSLFAAESVRGLAGNAGMTASDRLSEVGQRLATGDIANASAIVPDIAKPLLVQGYANAFESLTHVLAAITLLSAIAIFVFLGRDTKEDKPVSGGEAQPAE